MKISLSEKLGGILEGIAAGIVVLAIPIYILVSVFTIVVVVCIDVSRCTKKWLNARVKKVTKS